MDYRMQLRELTNDELKEIKKIMQDFITYILARQEKIDGRYTGSELTNYIYGEYLKSLSEEEQTLFFENILLYLSTFKKQELLSLFSMGQKFSIPGLIKDYKNNTLPDFLTELRKTILQFSTFDNKEELANFIHEQKTTIRDTFLANTKDYIASTTSTQASNEDNDFDAEQTEAEIIENNKIAMQQYKAIINNLLQYCNFLRLKLDQNKIDNIKENKTNIESIQNNCINAIAAINEDNLFTLEKLPLEVTELIKYTNFLIHCELEIDNRIMQQQGYIPKTQIKNIKDKKPISLASTIVNLLTKLLDTLLIIKEKVKTLLLGQPKPSTKVHRDEEADKAKKHLMLFYAEKIDTNIESRLADIRNNIAKITDLPRRKSK